MMREVAMTKDNPKYQKAIARQHPIYHRENDVRDDFERDYTRILYSRAFRRLKHKTQVFFAVGNDHVCTRLEHVMLVGSVGETIASALGLNVQLVKAIAVGHDLGHAPFGHGGERILNDLYKKHGLDEGFFHEKNSLYFVDHIETLADPDGAQRPLNLCYATRDGIIAHCGELRQRAIKPREEAIDLNEYQKPGQYEPYTYEGCVVKMADKIAYLSRDIEDAAELGLLAKKDIEEITRRLQLLDPDIHGIDNGSLIHYFIMDVIQSSSAAKGIALSETGHEVMHTIMDYNYERIYFNDRLKIFDDYVGLIIHSLFNILYQAYDGENTVRALKDRGEDYPTLIHYFLKWLKQYETRLYDLKQESDYVRAILDYISGMTDSFMIKAFQELVSF